MVHIGIYIIKSKLHPDRFYIGSAVNCAARRRQHFSDLRLNKHCNNRLQGHVNKYGIEDLIFNVVEEVGDKKNLISREQYFIDTLNPSFNLAKKAGSMLGFKHSSKTIEVLRLKSTGQKRALGHKKSNEAKVKQSNAMKGHSHNFGVKRSEKSRMEASKRMKLKCNGKTFYEPTDEKRKEMSAKISGDNSSSAVKVIDVNTGIIYGSIKSASNDTGLDYALLCTRLNRGSKVSTLKYI